MPEQHDPSCPLGWPEARTDALCDALSGVLDRDECCASHSVRALALLIQTRAGQGDTAADLKRYSHVAGECAGYIHDHSGRTVAGVLMVCAALLEIVGRAYAAGEDDDDDEHLRCDCGDRRPAPGLDRIRRR